MSGHLHLPKFHVAVGRLTNSIIKRKNIALLKLPVRRPGNNSEEGSVGETHAASGDPEEYRD